MLKVNSYFKTSEGNVSAAVPVTVTVTTATNGLKMQALLLNNDDSSSSITVYFDSNSTNTRTVKAGEAFAIAMRFRAVTIQTASVANVAYRLAIGGE